MASDVAAVALFLRELEEAIEVPAAGETVAIRRRVAVGLVKVLLAELVKPLGAAAFVAGDQVKTCPFDGRSKAARWWRIGWQGAAAEANSK